MARYIDANKLEKDLPQSVPKHNVIINGNEYPVFLVDHVLHKIRNCPTADVVEVVRCKDCKYYKNDEFETRCDHPQLDFCVECYDHWLDTKPNDFCSYGERK